jgi:hypothetical protein
MRALRLPGEALLELTVEERLDIGELQRFPAGFERRRHARILAPATSRSAVPVSGRCSSTRNLRQNESVQAAPAVMSNV